MGGRNIIIIIKLIVFSTSFRPVTLFLPATDGSSSWTNTALQSKNTVSAWMKSEQLLPFGVVLKNRTTNVESQPVCWLPNHNSSTIIHHYSGTSAAIQLFPPMHWMSSCLEFTWIQQDETLPGAGSLFVQRSIKELRDSTLLLTVQPQFKQHYSGTSAAMQLFSPYGCLLALNVHESSKTKRCQGLGRCLSNVLLKNRTTNLESKPFCWLPNHNSSTIIPAHLLPYNYSLPGTGCLLALNLHESSKTKRCQVLSQCLFNSFVDYPITIQAQLFRHICCHATILPFWVSSCLEFTWIQQRRNVGVGSLFVQRRTNNDPAPRPIFIRRQRQSLATSAPRPSYCPLSSGFEEPVFWSLLASSAPAPQCRPPRRRSRPRSRSSRRPLSEPRPLSSAAAGFASGEVSAALSLSCPSPTIIKMRRLSGDVML